METELESRQLAAHSPRLLSLDALRGFAMFWLIGGREFVLGVVGILDINRQHIPWLPPEVYTSLGKQLTHPKWLGFSAWDMVMPMFLFAVGMALPFALGDRRQQSKPLRAIYIRIARRVILLWLLGILYQQFHHGPARLELFSNALQAIAVGYLVASLALLHLSAVGQVLLFAFLLIAYDALLTCVPFGGHPAGTFEKKNNFARYVDELVLGCFRKDHAFAWIVPGLGFSATVMLGAMVGRLMKMRLSAVRRVGLMALIGIACLAAGWAWSFRLPINRYLWTSSLVLWAGGWTCLAAALLHLLIDVWNRKRWAFVFLVIGSNALLAYIIDPLIDRSTDALTAVWLKGLPECYPELLSSSIELTVIWLFLFHLYRKRKFFRV